MNNKLITIFDSDSFIDKNKNYYHFKSNVIECIDLSKIKVNKSSILIDRADLNYIDKTEIYFTFGGDDFINLYKEKNIKKEDFIKILIFLTIKRNSKNRTMFITENKDLLNIDSLIGFDFLNKDIFGLREGNVFIDLYFKKNKEFIIKPFWHKCNKGYWYIFSYKNKLKYHSDVLVSFYNNKNINNNIIELLESIRDRFIDMLIAIDEIGMSYYNDEGNDSIDNESYHFNYWIMLFTGIFDSLATISSIYYNININNNKIRLREFSESNDKKANDFLKELYKNNKNIEYFLKNNKVLIGFLYDARNIIAHRERLKSLRLNNYYDGIDSNLLEIKKDLFDDIVKISGDGGYKLGDFGHYKMENMVSQESDIPSNFYYIEPYRFVKKATELLSFFINDYLKILFEKEEITELGLDKDQILFNENNIGY